jgi:sec-independent protein translocase protein TatB
MSSDAIQTLSWERIVGDMFNIDPSKLLIIAVVAVILLGPDRLPQVARQVGDVWRTFNEYRHRMESQVRESMPDLPSTAEISRLARSPSALLTHLSKLDGADAGEPTPGATADVAGAKPSDEGASAPLMSPAPLTRPIAIDRPAVPAQSIEASDPSLN